MTSRHTGLILAQRCALAESSLASFMVVLDMLVVATALGGHSTGECVE